MQYFDFEYYDRLLIKWKQLDNVPLSGVILKRVCNAIDKK